MQRVQSSSIKLDEYIHAKGQSFTLIGRSRANDGTSFVIPELKWMFDCGALVKPEMQPRHIFLSHTHADHISALPSAVIESASTSSSKTKVPVQVYLPARATPLVDNYLKSFRTMCECCIPETEQEEEKYVSNANKHATCELVPCEKGNTIDIGSQKSKFVVRIVECDHRIDCIGFSISQQRQNLKEEYRSLPKKQLSQLCREHKAKNGHLDALMTTVTEPFLCFLGDTTAKVFLETHPEVVQEHKIIIVECTYLDGSHDAAEQYKHIHWDQLESLVSSHPTILFVLIHFSLRYSSIFIRRFFSSYRNVHPMLIEEEIEAEWQREQQKEKLEYNSEKDYMLNRAAPPKCGCYLCLGAPPK